MKRPPLELVHLQRCLPIFWLSLRRYPRKGISLATVMHRHGKDRVCSEIFLHRDEIGPIAEALIRELSSLSR